MKKGKRRGVQRYQYRLCSANFSSKRRAKRQNHTLFQDYFYHHQTAAELALKYSHCERWDPTMTGM